MSGYVFGKPVAMTFEEAVDRVTEELGKQGFGVLTDIDLQATMKKKLGQDMPPYRILGACNPSLASQAIAADPRIGALLPCNVAAPDSYCGGGPGSRSGPRPVGHSAFFGSVPRTYCNSSSVKAGRTDTGRLRCPYRSSRCPANHSAASVPSGRALNQRRARPS